MGKEGRCMAWVPLRFLPRRNNRLPCVFFLTHEGYYRELWCLYIHGASEKASRVNRFLRCALPIRTTSWTISSHSSSGVEADLSASGNPSYLSCHPNPANNADCHFFEQSSTGHFPHSTGQDDLHLRHSVDSLGWCSQV